MLNYLLKEKDGKIIKRRENKKSIVYLVPMVFILSVLLSGCVHFHKWEEANCTYAKTCKICGKTKGEALGHKWEEATCTEPKTCSRCGKTKGEALGHDWKDATCIEPKTCSRCSTTEGEALGHDWKDATCTEKKTCIRCGETEGDVLGHDWKDATCTEKKICIRCDEIGGAPLGHDWAEATCTEAKTCLRCGEIEGDALGHDAPNLSCTESAVCTRCGDELTALGHDWKEATCIDPKTCARCGETEGKALGHTLGDPVRENETKAKCTEKGEYDEVVYCSVCHEEISRKAKTEKALGHRTSAPVKENVNKATCTEDGGYDEVVYCSRCHEAISRKRKTEKAPGHTTANGKCDRCGLEIYETVYGKGDDVHTNITVGSGLYKVHFTNNGKSNYIVKVHDARGDIDYAVNEIGNYDGYYFLTGKSPFMFEIESNGKWSYTIESIGETAETSFNGHGCFVTDIFSASSGKWHITHKGRSNFVIWLYTTKGRDLIVNDIGAYEGNKLLSIPKDSKAFLIIKADGDWTITPEN